MTIIITLSIVVLFILIVVLSVRSMLRKEYAHSEYKIAVLNFHGRLEGDRYNYVLRSVDGSPIEATVVYLIRGRFFAHCGHGRSDQEGKIIFSIVGCNASFLVPRGRDRVIVSSTGKDHRLTPMVISHPPRWWQKLGIWG